MTGFLDTFGGFEIVANTKNFIITCQDDPGARQRALWVSYTCEADLARLNDLFSTNFEAGNTSDNGIWVNVLQDDPTSGSNGWNYGYDTEDSSRIVLQRAFTPPPPAPPSLFPPDPLPLPGPNLNNAMIEFPRFVFVAELAEILMDFTGYGWDAGKSPGEGLSNVLGALLHPAGYYDTGQGPRINPWLNGGGGPPVIPPRTDYVSRTVNTDRDIFSYGCAILFINYLVYQRGFSLKQVIKAGGSTLAETYARLTGEPASAAFAAMNDLLQAHIGGSTNNNMLRDNIFPLLDVPFRSVQTTVGDSIDKGHLTEADQFFFKIKPGIMCPEGNYPFCRELTLVEVPVFARARGTANAAFRWTVQGVDLPVHGQWSYATVNCPRTVKNPDGTETLISNTTTFLYVILDNWNGSALYLKTPNWNGNSLLDLTASAKEAAINEAEVSGANWVSLDTVDWTPDEETKQAYKRCNPFYAEINDSFWYLTAELADVKNRPDPPYEKKVREIIQAVEQLQKAVAQYAHAGGQSEAEVWRQVGTPGGLQSRDPIPAAVNLTLARKYLQEPDLEELHVVESGDTASEVG